MEAGVQRQLGARNKQGEGEVLGAELGVPAGRDLEARSVASNDPQPTPAVRIDMRRCKPQQMFVGELKQCGREAAASLRERLCTDSTGANRALFELGEQQIEFDLHAGAHARDHHCRDARKGQFALPGKGAGNEADLVGQPRVKQKRSELRQQR